MSGTILSTVGISDLGMVLIIGVLFLIIVLATILIGASGKFSTIMNGVDNKMYEQLTYDSIPKLREIANLYPSKKVGIQARKFLEKWDIVIEPSLKRLSRSRKRKTLRTIYLSDICPILEVYKQMIES
jgi:hypothetical protein